MAAASFSLRLNKAHYPVTVLGHGRRIGVWFQGCRIRCKGCVSQDTWDETAGAWVRVADMLTWCRQKGKEGVDGVTISGGEPFDQPQALNALLDGIHRWRRRENLALDVFCYSGYPFSTLQARHGALLKKLDALAPEPYVDALPEGGCWRGSANQPLLPLSPLGKARYGDPAKWPSVNEKRLQVSVEGGRVWMIGIPARGDMAALEDLCARRGLHMSAVSWRR
ncbi:MAG: radical SAM protein [Zoogloeaceae bacterium]|nr:radical SAM protein [Zoogloeaceae bacterium]